MSTTKIALAVVSLSFIMASGLSLGSTSALAQQAGVSLVKDVSIVKNASVMGAKAFSPNPVDIKVGGGVTWTNDDSQIHTVTSGTVGSNNSGSVFDSKILSPNATFNFVFDKAGQYDYYCTLHPQMVGKVIVS